MGERKRVTVHIGVHKTGTSAIQQQLHENAAVLRDLGLDYLVEGRGPSAAHHNIGATLRGVTRPGGAFRGDWNRVIEAIQKSLCQNILISTEILCLLPLHKIRRLATYLAPFDTRIVIVIRNQVEKLQSSYSERVKTGATSTISEFVQSNDALNHAEYSTLYETWSAIFGRDKIVLLFYEEIAGDICANFLKQAGFPGPAAVLRPLKKNKNNPSWPPMVVEMVRQINLRLQSRFTPAEYSDVVIDSLGKAGYDANLRRGGDLLTDEQAAKICSYYRESNEKLGKIRPLPEIYFKPRKMQPEPPNPEVVAVAPFIAETISHVIKRKQTLMARADRRNAASKKRIPIAKAASRRSTK